jgi:hypothetical protein
MISGNFAWTLPLNFIFLKLAYNVDKILFLEAKVLFPSETFKMIMNTSLYFLFDG